MKRIFFIMVLLFWSQLALQAQGDGGGRVRNLRKEFVRSKLSMSPQQEEKFWPIYNKYLLERTQLRNKYKNQFLNFNHGEKLSMAEAHRKVDENIEYKEQDLQLTKRYKEVFETILNPQQLADLYQSDREFKKMLIEKMRENDPKQ